mgnify:CR=1 FL=1
MLSCAQSLRLEDEILTNVTVYIVKMHSLGESRLSVNMQQKSAQTRQSKNQGPFILNEAMPDLMVAFLGWNSNFEKKVRGAYFYTHRAMHA